ncbi:MAG: fibronectin type III domain-containing protein [Candidatus Pacebacteria bacterium]|nr:fibronectin type III domain-containing protein [Candidatus Paceibacterota bacterium]
MTKKIFNLLLFLFVLGVFGFSLYKVLTISRVITPVFGARRRVECAGDLCQWFDNWCLCDWCGNKWCDPGCPCPLPEPTPTPPAGPTPTGIEPTVAPVATATPAQPTPTDSFPLPAEPTPVPQQTATPAPATDSPSSSGGVGGSGDDPGTPPHCGAAVPGAPVLLSVTPADDVELIWTEVSPATHYSIVYGLESGQWLYGVANTGRTTNFVVDGLAPETEYCFAVRAVNDCAPGPLSNVICTGQAGGASRGRVLGATSLAGTGFNWRFIGLGVYTLGCLCLSLAIRFRKISSSAA